MAARWEHFPHGADVGVRGRGPTPASAFAGAALALVAAMADPATVRQAEAVELRCCGRDLEDLLYAWLNEVVFAMATRGMLFGGFEVAVERTGDGWRLRGKAAGEPVAPARHAPAVEVKGATMTGLSVRREDGTWVAECIVDV